jgi:hypothetical protein
MNLSRLEQYLLEHTNVLRIVLLLAIMALLLFVSYRPAHADQPAPLPAGQSQIPAAVMGQQIPPLASFGVMQCGEVVAIWVILQDKTVLRTDAMHHPDTPEEYNAFLKWLQTAQSDIYEIPCPAKST